MKAINQTRSSVTFGDVTIEPGGVGEVPENDQSVTDALNSGAITPLGSPPGSVETASDTPQAKTRPNKSESQE
jgi:hypothetical protein